MVVMGDYNEDFSLQKKTTNLEYVYSKCILNSVDIVQKQPLSNFDNKCSKVCCFTITVFRLFLRVVHYSAYSSLSVWAAVM